MRIIFTSNDDGVTVEMEHAAPEAEQTASYSDILSVILAGLDAFTRNFLEVSGAGDVIRQNLYDRLDSLFGTFLENVFPEIDVHEFDITEAAIVYAQDQIISKAEKEGLTLKEALEKYEDMARAYIDQRRLM